MDIPDNNIKFCITDLNSINIDETSKLVERIKRLELRLFFVLTSCETYNSAYKMHE